MSTTETNTTTTETSGPQVWVAMGWQIVDGREPIVLVGVSEEAAQMGWDEYVAEAKAEDPDAEFELEYVAQQPLLSARR
jgi:hypothetical protein